MGQKILVDVDGTIADIHSIFCDHISAKFGTQFSVEDITGWGFEGKARELGLDTKSCIDLVHNLWLENWENVQFTDSSVKSVLAELKQDYTVDIVTATAVPEVLNKWILKNTVPHNNFIIHSNKHELDYDIYIEDNPNLHQSLDGNKILLLKDRPWNRNVKGSNVIRFSKFDEIVGILDQLEK